jgi:hypothetical protein
MEYTERVHANMLLRILSKTSPCLECPQSHFNDLFEVYPDSIVLSDEEEDNCRLCRKFVGANLNPWDTCPCHILGEQECIKRTWIALEEKGYLE